MEYDSGKLRISVIVVRYAKENGLLDSDFKCMKKRRGLEGKAGKAKEALKVLGVRMPSDKPNSVRRVWMEYLEKQEGYFQEYEERVGELDQRGLIGSLEAIRDCVKEQGFLDNDGEVRCEGSGGNGDYRNGQTVFLKSGVSK